jgi:hypothetical protein
MDEMEDSLVEDVVKKVVGDRRVKNEWYVGEIAMEWVENEGSISIECVDTCKLKESIGQGP